MVGKLCSMATAVAMSLVTLTDAASTITFKNSCSFEIQLFDNYNTVPIPVGSSTKRTLYPGENPMFRHGKDSQATLAEIHVDDNDHSWYDISVIPTGRKSGPDSCSSLKECKEHTGGVGFNVPMQIVPSNPGGICAVLTCLKEDCADGYNFPRDTKTHDCPKGTNFEVIFCPGGASADAGPNQQQNQQQNQNQAQNDAPKPTQAPPTPPPTTTQPPTPPPTTTQPPTTQPPTPPPTTTQPPTTEPPTLSPESLDNMQKLLNALKLKNSTNSTSHSGSKIGRDVGDTESDLEEPTSSKKSDSSSSTAIDQASAPASTTTAAPTTTPEPVKANTKSSSSGSSKVGIILIACFVIAAALTVMGVFMVRQKRKQMEAMELKTPSFDGGVVL